MKQEDFNKVKNTLTFETIKAKSFDDAYSKTPTAKQQNTKGQGI